MNLLTIFGLFSVISGLIFYAFEYRSHWFILAFALSCVLGSIYGFLQGAWPFGLVEAIWSIVVLSRWSLEFEKRMKVGTVPNKQKSLTATLSRKFLKNIPGWHLITDGKMIYREFIIQDFKAAIDLINRIGEIAEDANHHPNIHLTDYRKLRVELTTHDVGGLSQEDFIEAGKINDLPVELKR
jgi:pterin-4a-carbinolamine dehydratase